MKKVIVVQWQDWREERRFVAWELYQKGWTPKRIAEVLEVTPGTVSFWLRRARMHGREALRSDKGSLIKLKLTHGQAVQLPKLLAKLETHEHLHAPSLVQHIQQPYYS